MTKNEIETKLYQSVHDVLTLETWVPQQEGAWLP